MRFLKYLLFFILGPVALLCYIWQVLFDIFLGCFVFDFFDSYEEFLKEEHPLTNRFLLYWSNLLFSGKDK